MKKSFWKITDHERKVDGCNVVIQGTTGTVWLEMPEPFELVRNGTVVKVLDVDSFDGFFKHIRPHFLQQWLGLVGQDLVRVFDRKQVEAGVNRHRWALPAFVDRCTFDQAHFLLTYQKFTIQ